MNAEDARIGQRIRYTQRFSAKARKRFKNIHRLDWKRRPEYKLQPEPGGGGTAFVTGLSWRAMSNWTVDKCPEYYMANGTRELVLLCRKHIKGAEFVVQLADAELLAEAELEEGER